jgi:hypothetical protein
MSALGRTIRDTVGQIRRAEREPPLTWSAPIRQVPEEPSFPHSQRKAGIQFDQLVLDARLRSMTAISVS